MMKYGDRFIALPERFLHYCPMPKAAASTWLNIMAELMGDDSEVRRPVNNPFYMGDLGFIYSDYQGNFEFENGTTIDDYYSYVFIRHPISRLLSGYIDKFENEVDNLNRFWQQYIGTEIIRQFRPNASSNSLRKGNDVTFREFLTYVAAYKLIPHQLNDHFRPQHLLCQFCFREYDYIGKVEQISDDGMYIMQHYMDLYGKDMPHYHVANRTGTVMDYFKDIPADLMNEIYEMYRNDFEYFDYTIEIPF